MRDNAKKIIIICSSFLDINKKIKVGGVETYIKDLSACLRNCGFKCVVYQLDSTLESFEYRSKDIEVVNLSVEKKSWQRSFSEIFKRENSDNTIFIIATDQMSIKSKAVNVIAIQHGISYDAPGYMLPGVVGKYKITQLLYKCILCAINVRRFYYTKNTVCVDYNYYNWFRTIGTIYSDKMVKVIPNYASDKITIDELAVKLKDNSVVKKILFARRFVDYRGTIMFSKVIKRLFEEGANIQVTFAGNGPCEEYLRKQFQNNDNVNFTSFAASQSVQFHKSFHISVVPTIYSEGTSLSLCEAMAAGCFPICTHVGGMTNIILDHFNGLMCAPSENDLYIAIKEALSMSPEQYCSIVKNAYNSTTAFDFAIWQERWSQFVAEVLKKMSSRNER